uniref:PiggyBac transposable element-derived protein domain-containing protein n=1 Tax=Anopheles stephensi TaxID=30069 RepID=A0A182YRA8_ANOST
MERCSRCSNFIYKTCTYLGSEQTVIKYNIGKSGIDKSDQMTSYTANIRKSIKWYRKLAMHLLLGTTIVNAHIVYQEATKPKVDIISFREMLVEEWLETKKSAKDANNNKKLGKQNAHFGDKKKSARKTCAKNMCFVLQEQTPGYGT